VHFTVHLRSYGAYLEKLQTKLNECEAETDKPVKQKDAENPIGYQKQIEALEKERKEVKRRMEAIK
jgi:hypothetical protein